ncbi:hypothetical protein C1645_785568 [Glomus cerebriforme]|uniref:Uncharacterized protein n=1 Tax=Glomus cerebriforme TaxID=658196 RepID=A0A397SGB5_9GLOM|nr:hypothetical protein C1645_785568 [Glomus cerebriforme]
METEVIALIILALVVFSFIITLFVLGLKRVRKIKGNIPKYLILFLLAFICPPICIYIIKDDLKPDGWFKTIVTVLTCNYCCGLCDPNTIANCILTTCYIPGVLHALYQLFSVLDKLKYPGNENGNKTTP